MLYQTMDIPIEVRPKLVHLYWRETWEGQRRRLFDWLLQRNPRLEALCTDGDGITGHDRAYIGIRAVPIEAICGTEERAPAFDRTFHPIGERPRQRWLSIAEARIQGKPMPPVQLTEKDGCYYVRDGHHRISVAQALGEAFVEAEVVRIQVGSLR